MTTCSRGCAINRQHQSDCADDTCRGCLPRQAEHGQITPLAWDNGNEPDECANTGRALTHSLESSKEGLAMNATRINDFPQCRVTDCAKPTRSRSADFCETHYYRLRRTGTTDLIDRTESDESVVQRFLRNIEKTDTCWIYTGTLSAGYGQFVARGRRIVASRFAHELWLGPIPEGYQVDHVRARGCRDTRCVNPAHLEAVTPVENLWRGTAPPAENRRKTECVRGHQFTPENTGRDRAGDRVCKACRRMWNRKYRKRQAV
jgi:hypothetical protein